MVVVIVISEAGFRLACVIK